MVWWLRSIQRINREDQSCQYREEERQYKTELPGTMYRINKDTPIYLDDLSNSCSSTDDQETMGNLLNLLRDLTTIRWLVALCLCCVLFIGIFIKISITALFRFVLLNFYATCNVIFGFLHVTHSCAPLMVVSVLSIDVHKSHNHVSFCCYSLVGVYYCAVVAV